jgi:hypothetical protein
MKINQIINVEITSGESPPVSEPVGLQEMKDYLRLEGYVTNEDSPSDDFTFDDDLIEAMISEARQWVEAKTWVHVIPKTIEVSARCEAGYLEFPGPVTSDISLSDLDGNAITDARWLGTRFPKLISTHCAPLTATYNVGYSGNSPKWVTDAIKAYVAWAYENRGDEEAGKPDKAYQVIREHIKRPSWG